MVKFSVLKNKVKHVHVSAFQRGAIDIFKNLLIWNLQVQFKLNWDLWLIFFRYKWLIFMIFFVILPMTKRCESFHMKKHFKDVWTWRVKVWEVKTNWIKSYFFQRYYLLFSYLFRFCYFCIIVSCRKFEFKN